MSTRVPAEPVARGRSPRAPEREEADRGGGGDRGTGRDEPPRAARAHGLGSRMLPSPASLLGLEREVPSDPSYRDDVEEVELAVETLELVDPVIGEGDLLTRHRISDGSGDEDLAGLPDGHDAGPGVDGEAAHLGPHHLGLPEMDAGADLQTELADVLAHLVRASDGVGGPVEHREEAIPGGVEFAAEMTLERPANERMMRRDELAPPAVPHLGRDLG